MPRLDKHDRAEAIRAAALDAAIQEARGYTRRQRQAILGDMDLIQALHKSNEDIATTAVAYVLVQENWGEDREPRELQSPGFWTQWTLDHK